MERLKWIIPAIVALLILGADAFFVVDETKQVVITQFGKPVGEPIREAGLYFKVPLIQKANFFEKRILKWDGNPTQIPTKDKKYIWVDATARWRIKDPLLFLKRVGNITTAMSRLDGIIDSVVRDHVANSLLVELVRSEGWENAGKSLLESGLEDYRILELINTRASDEPTIIKKGREKITREMLADAAKLVPEMGIELLDIRIKRINYVESVQKKVFERMISERKRIAAQYRSEGEGEKAIILGRMEKELARIRSEAFRKSQKIRGEADAEATRIYAEAYSRDPEFYDFYRSLQVYSNFENPNGIFVFSTETEAFRYLQGGNLTP
ncbi:protease modulator HflC [Thermodesulforhabdus norvegica]|uniref:Protein HflC n=1 Tax=Thermodesulforhabdus norvegica TaxID=39841 RepID=A0A1I4SEG2_9BACT|nr:protease modulator HflC [Thermodesulforhabdus norvegica]SFM62673.1 protease FtsH subunit HflC [Thermodesulforhabdus norvegica]